METAAEATVQAAAEITKAAKKLLKAAQEGNIDHIRREGDQLTDVLASVTEWVNQAAASWPFTAEDEADYLDQSFSDELCSAAAAIGLGLQESGWKEWVTG